MFFFKLLKAFLLIKKHLQLLLTSLRTYNVTHSRFVAHFRILKNLKSKNFNFIRHKKPINLLLI